MPVPAILNALHIPHKPRSNAAPLAGFEIGEQASVDLVLVTAHIPAAARSNGPRRRPQRRWRTAERRAICGRHEREDGSSRIAQKPFVYLMSTKREARARPPRPSPARAAGRLPSTLTACLREGGGGGENGWRAVLAVGD